jgi:hypothetical protein
MKERFTLTGDSGHATDQFNSMDIADLLIVINERHEGIYVACSSVPSHWLSILEHN